MNGKYVNQYLPQPLLVKEGKKCVFHIVTVCPLYPVKNVGKDKLLKGGI
jgi:hypothetical protein